MKLELSCYQKIWRLKILVHLALLLGEKEPQWLYRYTNENYKSVTKQASKLLRQARGPNYMKNLKICRLDVSANLQFDDPDIADKYIRVLKKGRLISCHRVDCFRKDEKKVRDWKETNRHSYKQLCKSAAFLPMIRLLSWR